MFGITSGDVELVNKLHNVGFRVEDLKGTGLGLETLRSLTATQLRDIIIDAKHPKNVNLASDPITKYIYVSTAVIHCSAHFGHYWQLETWIFSKDPRQANRQKIHETFHSDGVKSWEERSKEYIIAWYNEQAKKIHGHIVENLRRKYV